MVYMYCTCVLHVYFGFLLVNSSDCDESSGDDDLHYGDESSSIAEVDASYDSEECK